MAASQPGGDVPIREFLTALASADSAQGALSAAGSPAAAVGLRGVELAADGRMVPGDIIVAIDGRPVESVARLFARLDDHQVGDAARLTILRDGRKMEVAVTLVGGA
jgi:S1-C subfamily serine protease